MNSVRTKVWLSMLGMIFLMLALLWTLQIGFLDVYYKYAKMNDVKTAATYIEYSFQTQTYEEFMSTLETVAYENDLCIEIEPINTYNIGMSIIVDMLGMDCIIHGQGGDIQDNALFDEFIASDDDQYIANIDDSRFNNSNMLLMQKYSVGDIEYLLTIATPLVPVTATKTILASQLLGITIVLIIFSSLVSFGLSRSLTQPIANISRSARRFAEGNFDERFDADSQTSLEIKTLANNFNYMAEEVARVDSNRKEMLASVSHDLRTPLTLIKGYAETIKDITGNNPERREAQLDIIIKESDRLNLLVEDMLSLSRMESGNLNLSKITFDLVPCVQNIVTTYDLIAKENNFTILTNLPEEALVTADKARVEQVIFNLLNNAVNHIGDNNLLGIDIKQVKEGFTLSVWDNGDGIEAVHLPMIWDRYYRVNNSGKRQKAGTGLGLSIVKEILEAHNATFGVLSEVGDGSRFWFTLTTPTKPNTKSNTKSNPKQKKLSEEYHD